MNTSKSLLLAIPLSLLTLFCSCATQPPPSAIEQKLFNIQTNYVPVVLLETNIVLATNYVSDQPVLVTNYVFVPTTNLEPQYTFSPNTNAAAIAQAAGNIGGFWGVGGITGTMAGALFSLWAWFRSRQAGLTADTLAQVIETGRQILLSLPNGEQYDEAWKTWMIQHQAEAGVVEQVAQIVGNVVDTDSARGAAQAIVDLIESQKSN